VTSGAFRLAMLGIAGLVLLTGCYRPEDDISAASPATVTRTAVTDEMVS